MKDKPFYTSKKFAYAALALVIAVAVAFLPVVFDLGVSQVDTLNLIAKATLAFGGGLIATHSVMDALSMINGAQPIPSISDAVDDLKDAVDNP